MTYHGMGVQMTYHVPFDGNIIYHGKVNLSIYEDNGFGEWLEIGLPH